MAGEPAHNTVRIQTVKSKALQRQRHRPYVGILAESASARMAEKEAVAEQDGGAEQTGDDVIAPPDLTDEPIPLPEPTVEGFLLKKCRRNGDDRPWKRRFFALVQGSLIYYHLKDKSDAPRLYLHLQEAVIEECEAPSGRGIRFALPKTSSKFVLAVDSGAPTYTQWLTALTEACSLPPVVLPPHLNETSSSALTRVKSALASAFATSRLGRHLIKRHLDESARALIRTVIEFATLENSRDIASKLECYIFDVAARVAVIIHANALPPDLDASHLYEHTVDFCMLFLRYSRDRRLEKARKKFGNAAVSVVNLDALTLHLAHVCETWRGILLPHVSEKVIDRYDFIVHYLLSGSPLRAVLDNVAYREHMNSIDTNLRKLLETY